MQKRTTKSGYLVEVIILPNYIYIMYPIIYYIVYCISISVVVVPRHNTDGKAATLAATAITLTNFVTKLAKMLAPTGPLHLVAGNNGC